MTALPANIKHARYTNVLENLEAHSGYMVINADGTDMIAIRRNKQNLALEAWQVTSFDREQAVRRARGLRPVSSDSEDEEEGVEIEIAAGALPPYPEVVFEHTRQPMMATKSAAEMASFIIGQREFKCDVCFKMHKGEPGHYDGTGAAVCLDCLGRVPTATGEDGCIICNLSGGPPTTGHLVLQCDACGKFTCRACYCKQPYCKPYCKAHKACAHCNKPSLMLQAGTESNVWASWKLYGM